MTHFLRDSNEHHPLLISKIPSLDLQAELEEASKHSRDIREEELASQIHAKHKKDTPEYINRLKNIKKGEATRQAWQTMKFLKTQSGATQVLNRINIPTSWPPQTSTHDKSTPIEDPAICVNWRTVTNPDEIEHYIRLCNHGHFGQAQGTPFTELPL